MLYGVARGISGIVYDPYIGAKQSGLKGGGIGVVKGLGGVVARPIKGCFDFVAQPIVGIINTPHYIYKRLRIKKDPTDAKDLNFSIFGLDEEQKKTGKKIYNPIQDTSSVLLFDTDEQSINLDNPDFQFCDAEEEKDIVPNQYEQDLRNQSYDVNNYINIGEKYQINKDESASFDEKANESNINDYEFNDCNNTTEIKKDEQAGSNDFNQFLEKRSRGMSSD